MATKPTLREQQRRRERDLEASELLEVEFVRGGPLDGVRLRLRVARVGAGIIHVVERGYNNPQHPLWSSEVEKEEAVGA